MLRCKPSLAESPKGVIWGINAPASPSAHPPDSCPPPRANLQRKAGVKPALKVVRFRVQRRVEEQERGCSGARGCACPVHHVEADQLSGALCFIFKEEFLVCGCNCGPDGHMRRHLTEDWTSECRAGSSVLTCGEEDAPAVVSVLASCQTLFLLFIPPSLLSLPKKPPSGHSPPKEGIGELRTWGLSPAALRDD